MAPSSMVLGWPLEWLSIPIMAKEVVPIPNPDSKTLMVVHKTLMVVLVAPVEKNVVETMCLVMFGEHVRAIELGKAGAHKKHTEG